MALAISALVMAAALRGLSVHLGLQRARASQARAQQVVSDVTGILRLESSRAVAPPIVRGDTAIDLSVLRGVATACEVSGTRLVVPASAAWWEAPRAGDSIAILDTLTRTPWRSTVLAVGVQRPSAACPAGGTRLTLAEVTPGTVPALFMPAQLWHTARYVVYRAADGLWWLGQRACPSGCGTVQPVAGPLPPGRGLRVRPRLDSTGRTVGVDFTVAASIDGAAASAAARLLGAGYR